MASFHLAIFGTDQRSLCGEAEPGDLAASMRTFQASLVDCRACLSAAIRNESGALARLTTLIEHENFALRSQRDSALAAVARLTEENERLALRVSELEAFMDAAQAAIVSDCVEHTELNGHIDTAEELRDWLSSEAFDGETGGKLADYIQALGIVIEQFDKQRRRANWHEAGYKAGKQKLIDYAVDRALARAREAARRFVAHVDDLGAFSNDDDPRVLATAGPLGEAQADLWAALGLSIDEERARLNADIDSRCAVCGWTLAESADKGCVRGNCSYRPRPEKLYAPARAARESTTPPENKP